MTREELVRLRESVKQIAPDAKFVEGFGGFGHTALVKIQSGRTTATRSVTEPVADVAALIAAMRAELPSKAKASAEVKKLVDNAD